MEKNVTNKAGNNKAGNVKVETVNYRNEVKNVSELTNSQIRTVANKEFREKYYSFNGMFKLWYDLNETGIKNLFKRCNIDKAVFDTKKFKALLIELSDLNLLPRNVVIKGCFVNKETGIKTFVENLTQRQISGLKVSDKYIHTFEIVKPETVETKDFFTSGFFSSVLLAKANYIKANQIKQALNVTATTKHSQKEQAKADKAETEKLNKKETSIKNRIKADKSNGMKKQAGKQKPVKPETVK